MKNLLRAIVLMLLWGHVANAQVQLAPGQVLGNSATGTTKAPPAPISGVDTNTLLTKTANYTIANTDCGKRIQAGSGVTGQFTVTLPSISGFDSRCKVSVINGDTGRGKVLAGFPTNSPLILWPQQGIQVAIVNGAWQTTYNPGVWMPATIQTLNVDHTNGSDTSDCLGAIGTSGACRSIAHAFALFQTAIKVPFVTGFYPTIQSDCGFTESLVFIGATMSGSGLTYIQGNPGTPANCVWNSAVVNADLAVLGIDGFTMRSTGAVTLTVDNGAFVAIHNTIWGATASGTGTHIYITGTGSILAHDGGSYQVGEAACAPNCAAFHIQNVGGTDRKTSGGTINVPNALTTTAFYYGSGSGSNTNYSAMTVSGAGVAGTTGFSYLMQNGAQADGGAAINYPGTSGVSVNNFACARGTCSGRELLIAARSYYVRSDGNDACNGKTNAAGSSGNCAFLTYAKFVSVLGSIDLGGQTVTVQQGIASATFTVGPNFNSAWIGGGAVTIDLNSGTINQTSGAAVQCSAPQPGVITLQNGTVKTSSGSAVVANSACTIALAIGASGVTFGGATNYDMLATAFGTVYSVGSNYTISGTGTRQGHYNSADFGLISTGSNTVTLGSNITVGTVTTGFAFATKNGLITTGSTTFSLGAFSCTGQKYFVNKLSLIDTSGGGAGYFPCATAGSADAASFGTYQ